MSRKTRLPPKKDVALALLENSTLFLHLDPRHDDVKVPPWFKRQPQLVLQVGLNMPVPIPDLNLDDSGVSCTLSFNRAPHFCFVPWASIFALVGEDGRGMVWPEDVPSEVAAQVQAQTTDRPEAKPRARLHAVDSERATEAASASEPGPQAEAAKPEAKPATTTRLGDKKPRKKAQKARAASTSKRDGGRPARPMLAPVEQGSSASKGEANKPSRDGKKKRELPPYLRVVK